MQTKNLVSITTVALATALVTVVMCWSGSMEAGSGTDAAVPTIATPKLVSHGVEMTLAAAEGRIFKTGDAPAFDLKAVNTTDNPVTVQVGVVMTATAPADRMSRVLVMPTNLWQEHRELVLQPHETKQVTVATQTKLPAGKLVSVRLQASTVAANQSVAQLAKAAPAGIVALNFSTAVP